MRKSEVPAVLLAGLVLAAAAAEAQEASIERTESLRRAENSVQSGWLRQYDYNQHRDLGQIADEYFAARARLAPELLVQSGLLVDGELVERLRERWRQVPVKPEEKPFAIDLVTRDGLVRVVIYTRVVIGDTLDSYTISLNWHGNGWVLDECGLVSGICQR